VTNYQGSKFRLHSHKNGECSKCGGEGTVLVWGTDPEFGYRARFYHNCAACDGRGTFAPERMATDPREDFRADL
jgi:DnaJ-class molecular chaperone